MIEIPRFRLIALGLLMSAYFLVFAIATIDVPADRFPVIVAMVTYAAAVLAAIFAAPGGRFPLWLALCILGAAVLMTLLCVSQLDPDGPNDYATWFIGAFGVVMAIVLTRGAVGVAWVGTLFLVVTMSAWLGPLPAFATSGITGAVVWVAVAHLIRSGISRAERNVRAFAAAERQASQWNASREATIHERQARLASTAEAARPLLEQIVAGSGRLDEAQRAEALLLEAQIRDEIRGRGLLDERTRAEIGAARRRGVTVTVLDEGGLDDLPEQEATDVRRLVAAAVAGFDGDRLIIRSTTTEETAVTVVGLADVVGTRDADTRPGDGDDDDPEVRLWLQIPRSV